MDQFPGNSKRTGEPDKGPKRVERVTSANAVRRRRPLGRQFKNFFFSGDAKTSFHYMVAAVVFPEFREMFYNAGTAIWEHLVFGESRRKRGAPTAGPLGYMAYNRQYQRGPQPTSQPVIPQRTSRPARARHDFGEVIISTRQEAEEVLDRLFDLLDRYESATVADLYELTGLESSHTDHKWGWTELQGSRVGRVRTGGYILELPEPVPLG